MNSTLEQIGTLLGRVLLSIIFLMSGFGKIRDWPGTAEHMESYGMPLVPFFLTGAIIFELAGGLSLLLGFRARVGALLLIVFLIPATIIFHAFWNVPDEQMRMQMIQFLKNLAIMGGLFVVLAHGAGPISIDGTSKPAVSSQPKA